MNAELLYKENGLYGPLEIYRENDCYTLRPFEGYIHSKIYFNDPLKDQTSLTMTSLASVIKPQNALILGAGLFENVIQLLTIDPNIQITSVDIEPILYDWGKKLCGSLINTNVDFIANDARDFISNNTKKYDYIIVDLFNGKGIPYHCATKEFFSILFNNLSDDGVLLFNTNIPATYQYFNYCIDMHPLHIFESTLLNSHFQSIFVNDITNMGVLIAFKKRIDVESLYNHIEKTYQNEKASYHIRASLGAMMIALTSVPESIKAVNCFQDSDDVVNIKNKYERYILKVLRNYLKNKDNLHGSYKRICSDHFYNSITMKDIKMKHILTVKFLDNFNEFLNKESIRDIYSSIYVDVSVGNIKFLQPSKNILYDFYQMILLIRNNRSEDALIFMRNCIDSLKMDQMVKYSTILMNEKGCS